MRCHRLFCPDLTGSTVVLSPEESHHAATSLRLGVGDGVVLFDGAGSEASGLITRVNRKRVDVEVSDVKRVPFELTCRLTLGVAMGRTHRQAYLVEKCTELGVAAIWPIIAEHDPPGRIGRYQMGATRHRECQTIPAGLGTAVRGADVVQGVRRSSRKIRGRGHRRHR